MKDNVFPPFEPDRQDFFSQEVYTEALKRYPSIADLVTKKAEENGEKVWLITESGRRYSYREVDTLSDGLATGFSRLGIQADDKVAVFAYNSPEWILSYFAALKLGAVPVTVNTGFIKDPLAYNIVASHSNFLVVDARLLSAYKQVEAKLTEIRSLILIGKEKMNSEFVPAKPYVFLEDLLTTVPDPSVRVPRIEKDICAMILTSGTTGPSKVVMDCNGQFISTALFMIDAGGLTSDSVLYVYLPLFHIMALDMATIASILANTTMVLVEKFSPTTFWQDIKDHGVTHFHAVGPILEMLFKQPPSPLEQAHGPLTAIAYSSKEVWTEAVERFQISITGGYGSTEVGIPVSAPYAMVRQGKNPPGSCGLVGPHVEVKLMDEQGRLVKPGTVGEIVVRPNLPWTTFLGYYGMPEQTLEAFRGMWFHTGDAGCFDENGYLYFVDRVKDAIRRRGENISSYEVEQALLKHSHIMEAAVIPAPSDVGEDEVMAVVVAKANTHLTAVEVVDYCVENMPNFWVPRYVRFMEGLPRTPTGRIEKFKLKGQGITQDTLDLLEYRKTKRDSASKG